jgi:hypothetical protein
MVSVMIKLMEDNHSALGGRRRCHGGEFGDGRMVTADNHGDQVLLGET